MDLSSRAAPTPAREAEGFKELPGPRGAGSEAPGNDVEGAAAAGPGSPGIILELGKLFDWIIYMAAAPADRHV